jgi:hypothetical protein
LFFHLVAILQAEDDNGSFDGAKCNRVGGG